MLVKSQEQSNQPSLPPVVVGVPSIIEGNPTIPLGGSPFYKCDSPCIGFDESVCPGPLGCLPVEVFPGSVASRPFRRGFYLGALTHPVGHSL